MNELSQKLEHLELADTIEKAILVEEITRDITAAGYEVVELDDHKPWGAYARINGKQADQFVKEFFPTLSPGEARLGNETAELSPKILIVAPNQRLSWQYHNRRAERWAFLSDGGYHKSLTDEEGSVTSARKGDVVQFTKGERHRLVASRHSYTIVAEIWQHSDSNELSNEADIVRLADDYKR